MKMLIVGIDGFGKESLEAFGLKRLKARLEAGSLVNSGTEHRISRGWTEIYTGETAWTSGCFYQVPVMGKNGTILPTQKTGLSTAEAHLGRENMLWNRLAAIGYKVGVFTLPTVTSPFETEGFCVAATGGGKFGNSIDDDDLFPRDLLTNAHIADLDLGLRSGYGGFIPRSLSNLETKVIKHLSDYFFTLSVALERRPVDVAIVGTRLLTEMAYKFIQLVQSEPTDAEAHAQKELVLALCERFDLMLDKFVRESGAENVFVISDHGVGPLVKEFNINEALVDLGYVERDQMATVGKRARRTWRRWRAKRPMPLLSPELYRLGASRAYSIGYIDALYVRDARFGGPAMSTAARHENAAEVAERLNTYMKEVAGEPDIVFSATLADDYASGNASKSASARIASPDVRCLAPRGYFNGKMTRGFIAPGDIYFGNPLYSRGFPGEFSGTKVDDTLTGYCGPHGDAVTQEKLTDLYGSILRVAERMK